METKKYIFNEKRIVNNLYASVALLFFSTLFLHPFIIYPIVNYFFYKIDIVIILAVFLLSLPICLILIGIANLISNEKKFTKSFLKEIKEELSKAKTIEELNVVYLKLYNEAVDDVNKTIRLSFALEIKEIFKEINNKIDILSKQIN